MGGEENWTRHYAMLSIHLGSIQPDRHFWAGIPTRTLSLIDIPPETQPDANELRLTAYDPETLKPAYEAGTWPSEVVVARVQARKVGTLVPAIEAPPFGPNQSNKITLLISSFSCHFDRIQVVCTVGKQGLR